MNNAFVAVMLVSLGFSPCLAADKPTSSEQLGKLLTEMGHSPLSVSDDVWQISIDRDNWKVHVMLALTRDGDRVWLESKFAPINDPAIVPAAAWLKLLEENERISPAHFAFDKSDQRIHLYRAFDNQNVTAARLKKELDAFDAIVRRTQAHWRSENFAQAETLPVVPRVAPRDPAAELRGKWRIVRFERHGQSTTEERLAKDLFLTIAGDTAILKTGLEPERKLKVRIDPKPRSRQIDFTDDRDRTERAIYLLENDLLRICFAPAGDERPVQFATQVKGKTWLLVLRKEE